MEKFSVILAYFEGDKRKERVVRKGLTLMGAIRVRNKIHKDSGAAVFVRKEDEI